MPNNYQRGVRLEYQVRDFYRAEGWIVTRSAGSRSPRDLVCERNGESHHVQCKRRGKLTAEERDQLVTEASTAGARAILAVKAERGFSLYRLEVDKLVPAIKAEFSQAAWLFSES